MQRLNALEVTLDLFEALIDTLTAMAQNTNKEWNKDTASQADTLLKRIDFEFLMNLVVTQSY